MSTVNNDSLAFSFGKWNQEFNEIAYKTFCSHRESPWSYELFCEGLTSEFSSVVMYQNTFAGFLLGKLVIDQAEIEEICVASHCRQKGIAASLLNSWFSHVKEKGAVEVFLEVAENNAGALALYQKAGFKHIDTRKAYYRQTSASQALPKAEQGAKNMASSEQVKQSEVAIDALVLQKKLA